jgi:two-component system response regulator
VLRRIRTQGRTRLLPIVLFSSSNEKQDLIKGYTSGANSYVQKPVDFAQLVELIGQIGSYWLGLNEAPPLYLGL